MREERKNDIEKTEADWGDHRVVQVFIRPEVFSIHMKGLKIRTLEEELGGGVGSSRG